MQTYLDNLLAAMLEENKRLATCVTTMKSLVDEAKIDCQINNPENSDNMKHSTEQNPEALQPAEKLRDAINRIELGFSDGIATNDLRLAAMELESLYTRVQELETLAATLNVWQQAIDAELVSAHLGVAHNDATFDGAQKAIHELICWHIDVATNPATNGGQRLTDAKPIELPEPDSYLFQHEDTGQTMFVDAQQVEWGFEANNPRLHKVSGVYTEQQVRALLAGVSAPAAQAINLLAADHSGMKVDYRGLFSHVQRVIKRSDPGYAEILRQLEGHLQELGQRWYAGDTNVVDEILQLYCIERDSRKTVRQDAAAAPQAQADALDAERYRWLRDEWLGNEPEAINMERAKGQRGLDAAIDAAIAAAKENK